MLSFPNRHIVFHQKLYVALISWRFFSSLKHVRILVREHQDYFSLTFERTTYVKVPHHKLRIHRSKSLAFVDHPTLCYHDPRVW